jgi:tRNA dimethylallyltransferase
MSIGTAKPSKAEQDNIDHYFIDSHSVNEPLSAGQYEKEALAVLKREFEHNDVLIMVGGSGMFIDAVCFGLNEIPTSTKVKAELEWRLTKEGIGALLAELKEKDPIFFESTDTSNHRRIIRALEAIQITGQKMTDLQSEKANSREFESHIIILEHDREKLYERINKRVDVMMDNGLLNEVKNLVPFSSLPSLNTVGYKELFSYLNNEIELTEAIDLIKRNTRRYAKRQTTWFNRYNDAMWIDYQPNGSVVERTCNVIRKKGIEI